MECEELVTYLSDYIDQNLDEDLTTEAQAHLATCQNCRVVLDTTQQTIFLYRQQGQRTIPAARAKTPVFPIAGSLPKAPGRIGLILL